MISNDTARRGASHVVQMGVVVSLLFFAVSKGAADDKAEAEQYFDEGKALFVEKKYEAAIESFQRSIDEYPTYNGYFNLANCYKALRRYGDALDAVKAMRETMGPSPKKTMRDKFAEFEASIMAVVGRLHITVKPDGATIVVDGQEIGTSPVYEPVLLAPGFHEVTVRKVGYDKAVHHVDVASEQDTAVTVALNEARADFFLTVDVDGALVTVDDEPVGKTPLRQALKLRPGNHVVTVSKPGHRQVSQTVNVVPGAKSALSLSLEVIPAAPAPTDGTRAAKDDHPLQFSPLLWSLLSGTAATVVAGSVVWGVAVAENKDFEAHDQAYVDAVDDDTAAPFDDKRMADKRKGERLQKAAIGLSAAAGVLAAATATIFVLEQRRSPSAERSASLAISPGGVTVRF